MHSGTDDTHICVHLYTMYMYIQMKKVYVPSYPYSFISNMISEIIKSCSCFHFVYMNVHYYEEDFRLEAVDLK